MDPLLVQEVFMGNVMSAGLGQVRHLSCKHTDCTVSASEHCSSNIHTGDPTVPGLKRQLHGLSSAAEGCFTTALQDWLACACRRWLQQVLVKRQAHRQYRHLHTLGLPLLGASFCKDGACCFLHAPLLAGSTEMII